MKSYKPTFLPLWYPNKGDKPPGPLDFHSCILFHKNIKLCIEGNAKIPVYSFFRSHSFFTIRFNHFDIHQRRLIFTTYACLYCIKRIMLLWFLNAETTLSDTYTQGIIEPTDENINSATSSPSNNNYPWISVYFKYQNLLLYFLGCILLLLRLCSGCRVEVEAEDVSVVAAQNVDVSCTRRQCKLHWHSGQVQTAILFKKLAPVQRKI